MATRSFAASSALPVAQGQAWSRVRLLIALAVVALTAAAITQAADVTLLANAGAHFLRTPLLLEAFVIVYASAFYLRGLAWVLLAPSIGPWRSFAILHASLFANHVAPVKAGEVLRPVLATERGLSSADAIATSVAARVLDLLSLVAIASVLALITGADFGLAHPVLALLPLLTVGSAVGGLIWLRTGGSLSWGPAPLVKAVNSIGNSLRGLPAARLGGAFALTLPSWVLEGGVVYIAGHALGTGISPAAAVAVTAFTLMFQMVHVTPGGIGLYEASMTGALAAFGIPTAEGLAVAVLAHALKFGYSFSIGLALTGVALRGRTDKAPRFAFRHLLAFLLVAGQAALVAGYFDGNWSVPAVIVGDAVLLAFVTSTVLTRQWLGACRPLAPTPPLAHDPRPVVAVIPAYNEAIALPTTLARIRRDVIQRVVVVDDGSSDGTAEIAEDCGADIVVRHERNRGLGAALRTALEAAKALDPKAVVYFDADSEYDPAEAERLLAPVIAGTADYVLGSRNHGTRFGQLPSRRVANAFFTSVLTVAAGKRISDGQTGFRAFSRRAVDSAEIVHDYNYAQVLTLNLLRQRMRLQEVPITWTRRCVGSSFVRLDYLWRVPMGMFRELLNN